MLRDRGRAPPKRHNAADLAGARRRKTQDNGQRIDSNAKPFVVRYQKHSGAMLIYGAYATSDEAERVCGLLRWAGAIARVERA